jgi:NAD(P)-dependent dehydrogenase (short-subunit alcohol dehydrogenase family)
MRVAIVTGGNRGIGRAVAGGLAHSGLQVVLTARSDVAAAAAAAALSTAGRRLVGLPLDVTEPHSVRRFLKTIADDYGRVDVLVNNAGIYIDKSIRPLDLDEQILRQTMETNFYGPLRLIRAVVPLMRRHGYGRIVNVSSRMGSLTHMGAAGNSLAYRTSKTALNALTRIVAGEVAGDNIKVNAASPGWVRTDMGGSGAPRTPAEGADTPIWLALLPADGPTGGFFQDRAPLDW